MFISRKRFLNILNARYVMTNLSYQTKAPGKALGRYIGQPDLGDIADDHVDAKTEIHSARDLSPPAHLETMGF
jgi:hypothetical protein